MWLPRPAIAALFTLIGCHLEGCQWQPRGEDIPNAASAAIRSLLDAQHLQSVTIEKVDVTAAEEGGYVGTVWLVDAKSRKYELDFRAIIQTDRSLGVCSKLPRPVLLEQQVSGLLSDGLRNRFDFEYRVLDVDLFPHVDAPERYVGLARVAGAEGEDRCHLNVTLVDGGDLELKWRFISIQPLKRQITESIRKQIQEQGLTEFQLTLGELACDESGELQFSGSLIGADQVANPITIRLWWTGGDDYKVEWSFQDRPSEP